MFTVLYTRYGFNGFIRRRVIDVFEQGIDALGYARNQADDFCIGVDNRGYHQDGNGFNVFEGRTLIAKFRVCELKEL